MEGHAFERRARRDGPQAAGTRRTLAADESPGTMAAPNMVLDLQRMAGNEAVAQFLAAEPSDQVGLPFAALVPGAGGPLEADLRARMESSLGTDFSDVRIHRGSEATASAAALGARAYTVGSDVVIAEGAEDERTLAHELTHVAQQRGGPVSGTDRGDGLRVSDPSDSFERAAEAAASSAVKTGAPLGGVGTGPAAATPHSVQRDAADPTLAPAATPAAAPATQGPGTSSMAEQWQANVVDQLADANAAFGAEPANAEGAFQSTQKAMQSAYTASDGLPETDPNRNKMIILGDQLKDAVIALAPRAGHAVSSTDSEITDHLGKDSDQAVDLKKLLEGSSAPGNAPAAASGTTAPAQSSVPGGSPC